MMPPTPPPWWHPARHAARRERLLARGAITRAVRAHFDRAGFVEVETPALQVSPGLEPHLHAFATDAYDREGGPRRTLRLATSPEFAMKKLLVAGETSIYQLARAYRNGERGPLHHPEFTMLEWYRVGADYRALMDDCAALLACAADATGAARFSWRSQTCDPRAAPERLTVAEAFARYTEIDLLAHLGQTDRLLRAGRPSGAINATMLETSRRWLTRRSTGGWPLGAQVVPRRARKVNPVSSQNRTTQPWRPAFF